MLARGLRRAVGPILAEGVAFEADDMHSFVVVPGFQSIPIYCAGGFGHAAIGAPQEHQSFKAHNSKRGHARWGR